MKTTIEACEDLRDAFINLIEVIYESLYIDYDFIKLLIKKKK